MAGISSCMGGLFGVVRSPFAADPGRASDVFVMLGALAEERGTGSAGLALLAAAPGLGAAGGGCRVVKGRGRFSGVWRPEFLPELDRAAVALGHTRWATQGAPAEITGVLQALAGRAALAWVEHDRPTEVHLARGALSPLAMAVDTDQNIYWASDPRWFREAERHARVRFATVVLLREGTYLKVGMERRPGRRDLPEVLASAAFTPAARDTGTDPRVCTGFTPAGAGDDRDALLHSVVERAGGAGGLLTVA
jgi:glucosamine 6-phosphate synthetase-like amidotransferase/phosphosugar isomerase protein